MGLIAKLLAFRRTTRGAVQVSEAVADKGAGANVTADHYSAPGVDSRPTVADYVLMVPVAGAGKHAAAGYVDPINAGLAAAGEVRLYARNAAGVAMGSVWLKGDGQIVIANALGLSVTLKVDGSLEHWTGAVIDLTGDIKTTAVPLVPGAMVSLRTHTHSGVTTGPGASGPPVPGV